MSRSRPRVMFAGLRPASISIAAVIAGSAGAALLPACTTSHDRITMQNFNRIETGMTAREVKAILGEPDKDRGGGADIMGFDASANVLRWEEGDRRIVVTFVQGKVIAKVQRGL